MTDEKEKIKIGERPWISYILGVIVLVVIFFFVFGKGIPFFPSGRPTPTPTQEISVTIEGVLGQPIVGGTSFNITTPSGFTTLAYSAKTTFLKEGGIETDVSLLKSGIRIRAEGKPNGKIFEAKKIIIVEEKPKVTPTRFSLPGTGIVE